MSTEHETLIEQLATNLKKRGTRIYTSEEHRALGPEYAKAVNTEVTQDGIRHFTEAVGDINPLYRDPEYANTTKYQGVIAPPGFLYSVTGGQTAQDRHGNFPEGITTYLAGSQREWYRPICLGDKVFYRGTTSPSDIKVEPSRFAGQRLTIYERIDYVRQGGDIFAGCNSWTISVDVTKAREQNKYGDLIKKPVYTRKDLQAIYSAQDSEIIRGAEQRYWEDIEIGQELPQIVRGPYTLSENIAFSQGIGIHGHVLSDRLSRLRADKDPGYKPVYDPDFIGFSPTSVPPNGPGFERLFAPGIQVEAWCTVLLTNWIGDDGFLWKLNVQFRGFTTLGDTSWCKGKIINKYTDHGKYCVDIDLHCENQRGEITIPGTATVILPSREHGPVVYPESKSRLTED